ncbi:hypothetical protein [Nocardia sp. NPDC050406]|uniref:hypothetical protein n=1 Tax=Nocardia sp. NPDC050406 TaxID=3364318 RepID=UPI003787F60D
MRAKGINYDAGIINFGANTHPDFDPKAVAADMGVIRDDLHCTAVRVTGDDADRLEIAARCAAEVGLEVWISPFTLELPIDELLELLADLAERAERLRCEGADVVLVTGAELSMFTPGFLPGATSGERLGALFTATPDQRPELLAGVSARINEFLSAAVRVVRSRFRGPVTYASIHYEGVDWEAFDFIASDVYRTPEVADGFADGLRRLVSTGKPVAITEFGCATYAGAAERGARAMEIVEYDGRVPVGLDGEYRRDEQGQAEALRDLLHTMDEAGVDSAFVYTFANFHLPHRPGARADLDLAGYGVVKVIEGGATDSVRWEPKEAFDTVAGCYATA